MNDLDYYAQRQRTTFDHDNMIAYAWRIKKYFNNCSVATDIGCGIGHQTVKLADLLPDIHFIILDKTGNETSVNYSQFGYIHNDLELTKSYTKNFKNISVYDIDCYSWDHPSQVVYSTLSWGWHYPIDLYIEQVLTLSPNFIIFDSRDKEIIIPEYKIVDHFKMNRKENTLVYQNLKR